MKKIFTLGILFSSFISFSQTPEQREVIKNAMDKELVSQSNAQVAAYMTAKKKRVDDYLAAHPEQQKTFTKDGKLHLLYDIDSDGNPTFINTKDNAQITNAKASSLYTGGSIGVNITGTNMIAGVWDGGQVNATHESLTGQVTMQAGQTLSDAGGNAHQTACTAMMVGKNINDKRGIAYNATTKNYDWDDDLTEMTTFADDGFLISNHSYGYGNGPGDPVWRFGAYNSQARAWDILLKSKPNYLPFVAVGNEQTTSGNAGDMGFDIITGSSASKNVVTVGAIDANNAMSDYSNWGPTDDGRVKPDIVTVGTDVESAVYTDNTSYTSGSGTSYSTPATAAGALLLQQYYFSLKNAYMPAAMLKALLLHSADDAGNPGPDAKFGWGILNLEKAAQIIKQSVAPNGTGGARMDWRTTNPANDSSSEQGIYGVIFATGDARASICWQDDEGVEQTSADAVDVTTNRMVYRFDMLFRRGTPFTQVWPYNNLSVTSPNNVATVGSNWFLNTFNNYLQSNLIGMTEDQTGNLYFRKHSTSPAAVRNFAVILTGLKITALSNETFDDVKSVVFFDKNANSIKLISNTNNTFENYRIYATDGKLVAHGNAATEILFEGQAKGVYIINYTSNDKVVSQKFMN